MQIRSKIQPVVDNVGIFCFHYTKDSGRNMRHAMTPENYVSSQKTDFRLSNLASPQTVVIFKQTFCSDCAVLSTYLIHWVFINRISSWEYSFPALSGNKRQDCNRKTLCRRTTWNNKIYEISMRRLTVICEFPSTVLDSIILWKTHSDFWTQLSSWEPAENDPPVQDISYEQILWI